MGGPASGSGQHDRVPIRADMTTIVTALVLKTTYDTFKHDKPLALAGDIFWQSLRFSNRLGALHDQLVGKENRPGQI